MFPPKIIFMQIEINCFPQYLVIILLLSNTMRLSKKQNKKKEEKDWNTEANMQLPNIA